MKYYYHIAPEERDSVASVKFVCSVCERPIQMIQVRDGFSLHFGKHECKAEKETPKAGKIIEMSTNNPDHQYNICVGYSTGDREGGRVGITPNMGNNGAKTRLNKWRYPGETDWRD